MAEDTASPEPTDGPGQLDPGLAYLKIVSLERLLEQHRERMRDLEIEHASLIEHTARQADELKEFGAQFEGAQSLLEFYRTSLERTEARARTAEDIAAKLAEELSGVREALLGRIRQLEDETERYQSELNAIAPESHDLRAARIELEHQLAVERAGRNALVAEQLSEREQLRGEIARLTLDLEAWRQNAASRESTDTLEKSVLESRIQELEADRARLLQEAEDARKDVEHMRYVLGTAPQLELIRDEIRKVRIDIDRRTAQIEAMAKTIEQIMQSAP